MQALHEAGGRGSVGTSAPESLQRAVVPIGAQSKCSFSRVATATAAVDGPCIRDSAESLKPRQNPAEGKSFSLVGFRASPGPYIVDGIT